MARYLAVNCAGVLAWVRDALSEVGGYGPPMILFQSGGVLSEGVATCLVLCPRADILLTPAQSKLFNIRVAWSVNGALAIENLRASAIDVGGSAMPLHLFEKLTYSEDDWYILQDAHVKACELLGHDPASYKNADRLTRTIMKLFDAGARLSDHCFDSRPP